MTGSFASSSQAYSRRDPVEEKPMNLRLIESIWHIRGEMPLAPEQSGEEAFDRLDPLFRQTGTSHERQKDTLTFRKKDAAAQDKMSVFDSGILQVEKSESGSVLRYDLTSRALLYCFLAPLLFLGFAQATIAINAFEKPASVAAGKAKKPAIKEAPVPMNPIDKALGAPAPAAEKPGGGGDADEDGPKSKKPSPTPAYVFAGIFVALYAIGRILEDRLVKSLFRKKLLGG